MPKASKTVEKSLPSLVITTYNARNDQAVSAGSKFVSCNDHLTRNVLAPMMMTFKDSWPTKDLQRNEDISSLSNEIESY